MDNELQEKREQELNQASYKLSDEISEIKDRLDKAYVLLSKLTDDYFEKFNIEGKKDESGIAYEFSKNATLAEIIFDYVNSARDSIDKLDARAEAALRDNKKNIA